jgi:hypothetical protein
LRRFGAGVDAHRVSPRLATEPLPELSPAGLATYHYKGMERVVQTLLVEEYLPEGPLLEGGAANVYGMRHDVVRGLRMHPLRGLP